MPSCNLDLEPLVPCKNELLKKNLKSSLLQMFFKIGCIKNFATFTGKHLCWSLFLIKLQVERSAKFFKIDSHTGVSSGSCKIFKNCFLIQHLCWLLLIVSIVKSAGVPFFDFTSPHAFNFDQNFHETLLKLFLLPQDQTISSLLDLIGHMLSISEYVLEKH